jgi:hypothetical protein
MDKVRVKWIDGVLYKSLYQKARIELGLEECPDLLGLEWQTTGQARQELPKGSRLLERFEALGIGGTLLVLGDPGAGKTTLLLELTADLLESTHAKDLERPVPVVLNLSSWGTYKLDDAKKLTLNDWLIEELYVNYQIRREIGASWLKTEQWILLLDGLDEVKENERKSCMEAINQFRQDNGSVGMALCCRVGDFKALGTQLRFQAAVFVQPLSASQVEVYLNAANLGGALLTVQQDVELQKLASNPLFLWILSLAYQNHSADELRNLPDPERLKRLFDRYIEQMFRQRQMDRTKKDRMIAWLGIIARQIGSGKEFLIERMQPRTWLIGTKQKWLYSLIVGLIVGSIIGLIRGLIVGLIFGLIFGLIIGPILGLVGGLGDISTVEFLDF